MAHYLLDKSFDGYVSGSERVNEVANMFGVGLDSERRQRVLDDFEIEIKQGQVVYITGGSGSGKSVILRMLAQRVDGALDLDDAVVPSGQPVVDCFDCPLDKALAWLSQAGLSDAFAILRSPEQLSDGQRYRFRLAMTMAQQPEAICIDEFCAALDRVTAAVVAHNVRRFADRHGTTFIVATSHDDLLDDLRPDVVVIKHLGSGCEVYYPGKTVKR